MRFMDEALGEYKPPSADDFEIALPIRREPKKEAEANGESRDLGQHGGANAGAQGAADAHNDVVSSGVAEPEPQRDEPDDGEHTDSTEQEVLARAQAAAAAKATEEPTAPAEAPVEAEVDDDPVDDAEAAPEPVEKVAALSVGQQLARIEGSAPKAYQKTGFSSGGVETLTVKRFPQPLVDRLRLALAPAVGGEFAESLSAPALITAFLMAKTGMQLDVDANTAVAVDVFRQVDPRLLAVEDKIDEVMADMSTLANTMKLSLKRTAETGKIADGLEFGMAYLIADRVAGLTTTDTNERNVDVTQKKVLVARENIRAKTKEQRTIEAHREGRRAS